MTSSDILTLCGVSRRVSEAVGGGLARTLVPRSVRFLHFEWRLQSRAFGGSGTPSGPVALPLPAIQLVECGRSLSRIA
jgi:hypothetical protein